MAATPVRIIPPSSKYQNQAPHFDRNQFAGKKRPNQSVEPISFSDKHNMHTVKRVVQRRIQTPTWALNDGQLLIVLVGFMEGRAFVQECDRTGTLAERLEYAERKLASRIPALRTRLHKFIRDYKELNELNERWDLLPAEVKNLKNRLAELEREIKNTDTQIVLLGKRGGMAGTILRVVHLYHRLGWDSVTVAKTLGLCPPHVHQILFQMNRKAGQFLAHDTA